MDLFIFDFDDTLAITDSRVRVIRDGNEILMTSREFAEFPFNAATDELDFGDFSRADGTLIKDTVKEMENAMDQGHDVFIVTARSIAGPVEEFLSRELGKHPPVIATAGSEGKGPWLEKQLASNNYARIVVYEDCRKNIRSLKEIADQAGVTYSAMCILEDQSMIQAESRWRREDILSAWDFRTITKNFLRKTR